MLIKNKKVMINSSGHILGSPRDLCGSECYEISEEKKNKKQQYVLLLAF